MTDLPPPSPHVDDRVTMPETFHEQKATPVTHLDLPNLRVTFMSADDVFVPLSQPVSAETEQSFRLHAERWYMDTLRLSSYYEKILHPEYQKILTLGTEAVPLILRELEDMPNDWFWALQILTEADPVQEHQTGDMQAMADAWLQWGHDEGYI